MSAAELALDELDVDIEGNSATLTLTIDVELLFDENGELRLWEDDDGWSGYVLEAGHIYHVNTWRDEDDPYRWVRVGERAVRMAIEDHVSDQSAGGVALFATGVTP